MPSASGAESKPPEEARIGPWRVLGSIDSGAYGVVYSVASAGRPELGTCALKLARNPGDERFQREMVMLSRLSDPNVPRLHDWGECTDARGQRYPYIVMQRVEGARLYDWARQNPLTERQALRVLAQLARALEATHQHGVHRDVKGDNVRVTSEGHAFLLDFGACWYPGARPLTDTAIPPGTEPYRSPQLLRFRYQYRRDPEAHYTSRPEDDIYALGVTAYHLVTGLYPPVGTDPECADDPERPRPAQLLPPSEVATVGADMDRLILRMLSKAPEDRDTAAQLAQELEQAAASEGPTLDKIITQDPSVLPTEHASRPGPPPLSPLRHLQALALLAIIVGMGLLSSLRLGLHVPGEPEVPHTKPQDTGEDAGSVSLGSTALASASPSGEGPSELRAVSLEVPPRPMKGQKRAPCESRDLVEINGGCWFRADDFKPPCLKDWYEWKGSCYWPLMARERPPTSEEP